MKGKTDIIAKLSDDKQYYGEYGRQFLSNSDIDALINDPASYGQPKEGFELTFGKAFHELVMFGQSNLIECVVDASRRDTKIYKEKAAEYGTELFLVKEYDQLMFIVDKVEKNKEVNELILGKKTKYEVPEVGVIVEDGEEILWKGKADIVQEDYVVDLKTTSSLKSFGRSVRAYNYDSQAYIYQKLFGKPLKFVAIDKNTGVAGIFDVGEFTLLDGLNKATLAQENYLKYIVKQEQSISNHTIYGTV